MLASLLVLLAGVLWGMIGLFVRRLNDIGFASMDIVTIRAITTTILLFVFLFVYDRKKLVVKPKDLWCFLGTGIVSIVFFNFCYFKAITLTSLSVAAVLLYTAPAIVMVLSAILFKEKITKVKLTAIFATFLGCVLVTGLVGSKESLSLKGIFIGLGAGLGYALYSIFSRFAIKRGYHSFTISFYTFLFAMLGTIPFSNYDTIIDKCTGDMGIVGYCLLFGLVSTVIPYIVYTRGLRDMENSKASIIASIEPVTATLLGVVVYKESLSISEITGVILVLGAIVISEIANKEDYK